MQALQGQRCQRQGPSEREAQAARALRCGRHQRLLSAECGVQLLGRAPSTSPHRISSPLGPVAQLDGGTLPYKDQELQRAYNREWIKARRENWFVGQKCARCGSVEQLEVHHVDRSTKVTHRIWSWSEARRRQELAKCEVLCSECHKKESGAQREPSHGTKSRYSNYGCRCAGCKAAKRAFDARYKS